MHKVLILTAGFGHGHNAAAANIQAALESVSDAVRVETLDLFAVCYPRSTELTRKLHLGVVRYGPRLWRGLYAVLDKTSLLERQMGRFRHLRATLQELLHTAEPDAAVVTYPAYPYVLHDIYRPPRRRPFPLFTVITDSISINSVWYGAPSDVYLSPNSPTTEVLRGAGVPDAKIRTLGFPVSPRFRELAIRPPRTVPPDRPRRILYVIHHGRRKAGRIWERLLEIPSVHITLVGSMDAGLRSRLCARAERYPGRVQVLGWSNQMPELLSEHDLVITKAGGAIVQEALAAACPPVINQVLPGQEEGNARLVEALGIGAVAPDDDAVVQLVQEALVTRPDLWQGWKRALETHRRPDAALRIAEFILAESSKAEHPPQPPSVVPTQARTEPVPGPFFIGQPARPLLCDFHTHSNYSDGKLTVPELVDFYGHRGFDCLCITDHLAERKRWVGRLANLSHLTLPWEQLEEYFAVIERERRRAWRRYSMIVMTGLEFNKDGLSAKSSAHLLGLDLQAPISPDLGLKKLIRAIHEQGGLAVASHPHKTPRRWGHDTLFLWQNQEEFAPLIDAWEIANRDDIFNPVCLKRLPFLANSDFHKPSHIYSWKTLLHCEKDPAAIKQCIRENQGVSITLYRQPRPFLREWMPASHPFSELPGRFGRAGEQLQLPIFGPPRRPTTVRPRDAILPAAA